MSGFRWQDPVWLLLWLPLIALSLLALRRRWQAAVLYSSVQLLKGLPVTLMLRVKRWLPWVRMLGLALVIAALARPQRGLREFRVQTEGIAIQMCLDRSGSMQALDFELDGQRVNRLAVVKKVFREFVDGGRRMPGRPNDLIGLIAFGGYAEGKAPLTLDHGALLESLDSIEIPQPLRDKRGRIINERFLQEELSTAIGDAVTLAVDRLKDAPTKSKVIVLLSDGESNAGVVSPQDAAETAKTFGIKIYSIGVGSTGEVPFPGVDIFGRQVLQMQAVRLDEETLRTLADLTGGRYFNAQDTAALEQVYAEIDRLEKTPSAGRLYTEYVELYPWFLLPGLALILAEVVLSATRFRSLP
jgi:Ca-activated chloride channel family protein